MARPKRAEPRPITGGLEEFMAHLGPALQQAVDHPESVPNITETVGNPITLAPRVAPAAEQVDKLISNATNAGQRWVDNTTRPRKDPIARAKASVTKYKNAMQESLSQDRYAKGLASIDESAMQQTIQAIGATGFVNGITARKTKITNKFAKLQPMQVALANQLDAMPTDTDAQREAKMLAAKRGMQAIGKQLKGG
jgi:hypothetical protein